MYIGRVQTLEQGGAEYDHSVSTGHTEGSHKDNPRYHKRQPSRPQCTYVGVASAEIKTINQ